MRPGRELDALVAEKVLSLEVVKNKKGGWSLGPPDYYDSYGEMILFNPLPSYSEDIAAAWEVLEKIRDTFDPLGREWRPNIHYSGKEHGWRAEFELSDDGPGDDTTYYFGEAKTAPHAICLAALNCHLE